MIDTQNSISSLYYISVDKLRNLCICEIFVLSHLLITIYRVEVCIKFTFISSLSLSQIRIARAMMQTQVQLLVLFLTLIHSIASLPPYIIKQHDEKEVLFKTPSKGSNPRPFSLFCEAKGDPPPK